jgi:hypothetical protein
MTQNLAKFVPSVDMAASYSVHDDFKSKFVPDLEAETEQRC